MSVASKNSVGHHASYLWAFGLALLGWGMVLPWIFGYQVHDSDSRLYVGLSQDLASRPWTQWCAPIWNGHWGREGLFVEHPPGLFWLGALFIKIGLPPFISLYALNQLAWMAELYLLFKLSMNLADKQVAKLAVFIWCLSPVFMQYLVRGNQEHPLAASMLLGLVAVASIQHAMLLCLCWTVALALGFFIKGLPALALLPLAFLLGYRQKLTARRWIALGIGTILTTALLFMFERWYVDETNQGFFQAYWASQVGPSVGRAWSWQQKLINLVYYCCRPLWFGQPAVGLIFFAFWQRWRRQAPLMQWQKFPTASLLGMATLCLFIVCFTLADRKADRYLFPSYPVLALSAASLFVSGRSATRLFNSEILDSNKMAAMAASAFAVAIALKIFFGSQFYIFIRLWPGA